VCRHRSCRASQIFKKRRKIHADANGMDLFRAFTDDYPPKGPVQAGGLVMSKFQLDLSMIDDSFTCVNRMTLLIEKSQIVEWNQKKKSSSINPSEGIYGRLGTKKGKKTSHFGFNAKKWPITSHSGFHGGERKRRADGQGGGLAGWVAR